MKKIDFIKDYKKRIEEILSKEVPHLDKVSYKEPYEFIFSLTYDIRLDTRFLEDVLNANGLEILSVMGLGDGRYLISPDIDYILDEDNND